MKRTSTFLIGVILLATAMLGAHVARAELTNRELEIR